MAQYSEGLPIVRAVLLDVEGTTTSLEFVREVLFPYAERHIEAWLSRHAHDPIVVDARVEVCGRDGGVGSLKDFVELLKTWMVADSKHTVLKRLQGALWRDGYAAGELVGHVYPEVPDCLRRWRASGQTLAVFSSGSIEAQRLLFRHSAAGDLTPLFAQHFDTTLGMKHDPAAYASIAAALRHPPQTLAFVSDVERELDAAARAGCITVRMARDGAVSVSKHPCAVDFLQAEAQLGLGDVIADAR